MKKELGRGLVLVALILSVSSVIPACGGDGGYDGRAVGGACDSDRDCHDRCLRGGDYPRGTCSRSCAHDGHCPYDTACVDKAGGVCLLVCDHASQCRSDYGCKREDRRGASGKVPVCIK